MEEMTRQRSKTTCKRKQVSAPCRTSSSVRIAFRFFVFLPFDSRVSFTDEKHIGGVYPRNPWYSHQFNMSCRKWQSPSCIQVRGSRSTHQPERPSVTVMLLSQQHHQASRLVCIPTLTWIPYVDSTDNQLLVVHIAHNAINSLKNQLLEVKEQTRLLSVLMMWWFLSHSSIICPSTTLLSPSIYLVPSQRFLIENKQRLKGSDRAEYVDDGVSRSDPPGLLSMPFSM